MDKVEYVARALCRADCDNKIVPVGFPFLACDECRAWDEFADQALLAIAAHEKWLADNGMVIVPREPTEAMVNAASMAGYHGKPSDAAQANWEDMIDAALEGK